MNRSKYASHYEEPYPDGLSRYGVLKYKSGSDLIICLKHFRGFTKCLKWNYDPDQSNKKKREVRSTSINYVYDKWILDLFEPFNMNLSTLNRHPQIFMRAVWLLLKVKMGKIK